MPFHQPYFQKITINIFLGKKENESSLKKWVNSLNWKVPCRRAYVNLGKDISVVSLGSRKWQLTTVLLPGKSHGQRILGLQTDMNKLLKTFP